MAWTYTPDFTTERDQIRLAIGDTIESDPLLSDEEIAQLYTQAGSVSGAAIAGLRSLAAKYSRLSDISVETVSKRYSQRASNYLAMATALEVQGAKSGATAGPAATGISLSEMASAAADPDRPPSQNSQRMFDNQGASDYTDRFSRC